MNETAWQLGSPEGLVALMNSVPLTYQGTNLLFARPVGRATTDLYYKVRNAQSIPGAADEWSNWTLLPLTPQSAQAVGADREPQLRILGIDLITVPISLLPGSRPTPVDAPFQVVTDERSITVLRVSQHGTLLLDRFVLVAVPAPQSKQPGDSPETPSTFRLQRLVEVRYRRSGLRDIPAGPDDSLGTTDMLGKPFYEPVLELVVLPKVSVDAASPQVGNLTVVLGPSATGEKVWHFFVTTTTGVAYCSFTSEPTGLPALLWPGPSFTIAPMVDDQTTGPVTLTPVGAVGAEVYEEQETIAGPEGPTTQRRSRRLMVAMRVTGAPGLPAALAVVDFQIQLDGMLPAGLPNPVPCLLLDGALNQGRFTWNPANSYPVPDDAIVLRGSAIVYATMLGQAQPSGSPTLLNGSDGFVHCYFAGPVNSEQSAPLQAVQFQPLVSRATIALSWSTQGDAPATGDILFISDQPGTNINNYYVIVNPVTGQPDLCSLNISYGGRDSDSNGSGIPQEGWDGLPRDIRKLAAILNGQASDDPQDRRVQSGEIPFYDFRGVLYQARLPLTAADGTTGYLTLLGHRLDVQLASVTVGAATNGLTTLTFSYQAGGAAAPNITQTWSNMPAASDQVAAILRGTDSRYAYAPASTDTPIYGLGLVDESGEPGGTMLLFSAGPSDINITVTPAENDEVTHCNVLITGGQGVYSYAFQNVPRRQAEFLYQIAAGITSLIFTISAERTLEDQVANDLLVPDTTITAPMSLRETAMLLFDQLPATQAGTLQAGTLLAAVLQKHGTLGVLTSTEATTVRPDQLPPPGEVAWLNDTGGSGVITPAFNGNWVGIGPAPQAGQFTGSNYLTVPTAKTLPAVALIPGAAWTIEAWCQPSAPPQLDQGALVLSYNGLAAAQPGGVQPSYYLGLESRGALEIVMASTSPPAATSYFQVQSPSNLPDLAGLDLPQSDFTIEVWVNLDSFVTGTYGTLLTLSDEDNTQDLAILAFGFNDVGAPVLMGRFTDDPGHYSLKWATANALVTPGVWTHVAVSAKRVSSTDDCNFFEVFFYLDGVPVGTTLNLGDSTMPICPQVNSTVAWLVVSIGAPGDSQNAPIFNTTAQSLMTQGGIFSDLRLWSIARSQADIQSGMGQRCSALAPGLLANWEMIPTEFNVGSGLVDSGPYGYQATTKACTAQPVVGNAESPFVWVVAGIGGGSTSRSYLTATVNQWTHLAATFGATGALSLQAPKTAVSPKTYGICQEPSGLSLGTSASFEAWVLPSKKTSGVICAQWGPPGPGDFQLDQAYKLEIGKDGRLSCTITVTISNSLYVLEIKTSKPLTFGIPNHAVVTWSNTPDTSGVYSWTGIVYVDGVPQPLSMALQNGETAEGFTPKQTYAKFMATSANLTGTGVPSKAPFTVGVSALPTAQSGPVPDDIQGLFTGVVTGIRIWGTALTLPQVTAAMNLRDGADQLDGVVSAWWFSEQQGQTAQDSAGDNLLYLTREDLWAQMAQISLPRIYVNGAGTGFWQSDVSSQTGSSLSSYYLTGAQNCLIGAGIALGEANPSACFTGTLAELRVWAAERTAVELASTMYRPLTGREPGLRAYWRLNGSGNDLTGNGNNAAPSGSSFSGIPSTAPVGDEPPPVQDVYGGPGGPVVTPFQQAMAAGKPAAFEIGVLDRGRTGLVGAELFRGLVWEQPPQGLSQGLAYFSNYGIGTLDLVYLGQAQSKPTLIGYIEGAPPVPSENLSRPLYQSVLGYNSYMDASTIALTQTQTDELTFSRDRDQKWGVSVSVTAGVQASSATQAFVIESLSVAKVKGGAKVDFDFKFGQKEQAKYKSSWTRTFTDRIGLRGTWEQDGVYVNPSIGRRYQPNNVGYALVEALTVDRYSLQLRDTGTMIGTVVIPNLDIGKQRNVIPFQINPRYVKNGTLDGKIGFANDPDYPHADISRGSYFKPAEAAFFTRKILRQEAQLKAWYDSFAAIKQGKLARGLEGTDQQQYVSFDQDGQAQPKRGIANLYVWSAVGGLHKEEESFLSSYEITLTGSFSHTNKIGDQLSMEAMVGGGWYGSLDLMETYSVDISVAKAESESYSVGMAVEVTGDPMLLGYVPGGTYTAAPQPGKVSAYRFQSFYLPPGRQNAEEFLSKVVDRVWLSSSSDPGAIALREAQIDGNKPWRVLHRVTYVDRVPPSFAASPAQQVASAVPQPVDIEDNLLLAKLLQTTIGLSTPSRAALGAALTQILDPESGVPGLETQVSWWQDFVGQNTAEVQKLLGRIEAGAMAYFSGAYANRQLPAGPPAPLGIHAFRRGRMPKLSPKRENVFVD